MGMRPTCFILAGALLLTGCVTTRIPEADREIVKREQEYQKELVVRTILDRDGRLADLAFPILAANTELCGNKTEPLIGIAWATRKDLPDMHRSYRKTMKALGVGKRPMRTYVTTDGPADVAGLKAGDILVAVDGKKVPTVGFRNPRNKFRRQLRKAAEDGVFHVDYERGPGTRYKAVVEPVQGCAYPVRLVHEDVINAYADGNAMYITVGMYRFARNDLELQAVIAHELAHNSEGHMSKVLTKGILGSIVDVAAAADGVDTQGAFSRIAMQMFNKDFEREADYVSMYMLERAGIDATEAASLWRRMALEHPDSVIFAGTHPTTAERFVNLENAHKEIIAKRQAGRSLLPSTKREEDN